MSEPERVGVVVVDGAGDRYEVVDWTATFHLRSLDRPGEVVQVSSGTLRKLGFEWDGRTLRGPA